MKIFYIPETPLGEFFYNPELHQPCSRNRLERIARPFFKRGRICKNQNLKIAKATTSSMYIAASTRAAGDPSPDSDRRMASIDSAKPTRNLTQLPAAMISYGGGKF